MSYDQQKVSLICQGTFDTLQTGSSPDEPTKATMLQAATDIGEAGFGTVILGQWHVHADGTVYYNDHQYYPTGTTAPLGALDFDWIFTTIPAKLREAGNVQNVVLEFGGWDCNDFNHIWQNMAAFKQTMQDFFTKYPGVNGFDFDPEGGDESIYYSGDVTSALTALTQWATAQEKVVTAVPYTNTPFWGSLLEGLNTAGEGQFSWWNIQGTADVNGYDSWVNLATPYITSPQPFITCGFNLDTTQSTPAEMTSALQGVQKSYQGLAGAFIWKYEDIKKSSYSVKEYGQAVLAGLGAAS